MGEVGLTAQPSKCELAIGKLELLVHNISQGYMLPEQENLDKLLKSLCPQTNENARSVVSMNGFH